MEKNEDKIKEYKSKCYDLIVLIERHQLEIQKLKKNVQEYNKMIFELSDKKGDEKDELGKSKS
jgi:hypothetical protein